ncbi:hypothetical protein [Rhodoferax sp.]|uniref:hypothetical protein n=1 Tax=Rhodoferax sp. TaxID=50421 RepID=UPI00274BA1C3|nr:hypothetical protein [Rhodoferax sp.]
MDSRCTRFTARICSTLALAALTLALGCAPDSQTTLVMRSSVDHLQSRETVTATLGTLHDDGRSAFLTSSILPQSVYTVHTSGRLHVARGSVQVSFVDREGKTQTVRATPAEPGQWKADVRARKNSDKQVGFFLKLEALEGQPPRADGIVMEVTFSPG